MKNIANEKIILYNKYVSLNKHNDKNEEKEQKKGMKTYEQNKNKRKNN